MKLAQRLFYYLGGFAIGFILLLFFLGGKKTSCDYSPTARVLKNIRIKKRKFSDQVKHDMHSYAIDTADISKILIHGDVNFSKSNTKLDSCKIYFIEGNAKEIKLGLSIKNCDSIATLTTLEVLK